VAVELPVSDVLVNGKPNLAAIVSIAQRVRVHIGNSPNQPLDLDRLSSQWECAVVPSFGLSPNLPSFSLGLLVPLSDSASRFRVVYNPDLPWRTRRFTIAHELVHTLFYSRVGVPTRVLRSGSSEEEIFCDRLAEELLLPSSTTKSLSCLADVRNLADEYEVSYDLAAKRYFWSVHRLWDLLASLYWDRGRHAGRRAGTFRIQWHLTQQLSGVRNGMSVYSPQLHRALGSASQVVSSEPLKINGRSLGGSHSALGLNDGSILIGLSQGSY